MYSRSSTYLRLILEIHYSEFIGEQTKTKKKARTFCVRRENNKKERSTENCEFMLSA